MKEIPAIASWPTNGHLIADVATLHLASTKLIFDATYGRGTWWTEYSPKTLITNDLDPSLGTKHHYDFRDFPFPDSVFDCVAYDPPYKLSGTNVLDSFDSRYGLVDLDWKARMELVIEGAVECGRVARNTLLVKCQDQVCSGQMRWQTIEITNALAQYSWRLADRFDMLGGSMPQPQGRRQVHARGRGSTLLVFKKA